MSKQTTVSYILIEQPHALLDAWMTTQANATRNQKSISVEMFYNAREYNKIQLLRLPSRLLSSGKYYLELAKTGLHSEVLLILGGLNSGITVHL